MLNYIWYGVKQTRFIVHLPEPFFGVTATEPMPETVVTADDFMLWQECQEDNRRLYLASLEN